MTTGESVGRDQSVRPAMCMCVCDLTREIVIIKNEIKKDNVAYKKKKKCLQCVPPGDTLASYGRYVHSQQQVVCRV